MCCIRLLHFFTFYKTGTVSEACFIVRELVFLKAVEQLIFKMPLLGFV